MSKTSAVQTYWWRGVANFGDALAPLLLEHFSEVKVEWTPVTNASIVSVGSILEHLTPKWSGYILGSGKLKEFSNTSSWDKTANILALRGPLSARGISGDFALGDPGLLADELVGPQEKLYNLGILPHWRDTELVARFTQIIRAPYTVKVINPLDDPLTVIRQIGSCQRMVTSSLHGMIVSDAFGIPRRVEGSPALAKEGGDFKFRDYSESIQTPFRPGVMVQPVRGYIEDVRFALHDVFRAYGHIIGYGL